MNPRNIYDILLLFTFAASARYGDVNDASKCCLLLDENTFHNEMMQCVNNNIQKNFEKYLVSAPGSSIINGPHLHVGFLTRATPDIFSYAAYSLLVQSIYAELNRYVFIPLTPDSQREDYLRYRKIVPLLEALNGFAIGLDYLVWVDAGKFSIRFIR